MPKFPDLSKLAKDLNIGGILDNVKGMLNPESAMPDLEAIEKNPALAKLVELTVLVQNVAEVHRQQAKEIAALAKLLNELYKELAAEHEVEPEPKVKPEPDIKPEPPKDNPEKNDL